MLGTWRPHTEYQQDLIDFARRELERDPQSLKGFETTFVKFYNLDLDVVREDFAARFSDTGRPSNFQPEIFRAIVLMSDRKESGIDEWAVIGDITPLFRALVGVEQGLFPKASTMRDFITRLWLEEPPDRLRTFEQKPKEKYGKEKKPPKNPGIIAELAFKALNGESFGDIPERLFQSLFLKTAVIPSITAGLIANPNKLVASADGTCIESHASPRGAKTEIEDQRRLADPQANWGWDSYHERWFFGYTGYILSTTNPELKVDLPIYLRFTEASQFDGVTFIKAFAHARALYSGIITFDSLLADSAHDNYATYNLLNEWRVKPFIDLNRRSATAPSHQNLILGDSGAPVCADGYDMVNWGYDKKRFRIKYRCPLIAGSVKSCPYSTNCNKSMYGKIVYIRTTEDLRLLTPVPRDSDQWKEIYKQRTAAERVNNRILTDYQLERPKRYGKKKMAFFAFINAINVHLDAQVKCGSVTLSQLAA